MKKEAPRVLCQDFNNINTGWGEERKGRWKSRLKVATSSFKVTQPAKGREGN